MSKAAKRMVLMTVMLASAASAGSVYAQHSPRIQSAANSCMRCQTKCSVCFNAGQSTFPSIDACKSDCARLGNPTVVATCGVRKRC